MWLLFINLRVQRRKHAIAIIIMPLNDFLTVASCTVICFQLYFPATVAHFMVDALLIHFVVKWLFYLFIHCRYQVLQLVSWRANGHHWLRYQAQLCSRPRSSNCCLSVNAFISFLLFRLCLKIVALNSSQVWLTYLIKLR